MYSFLLAIIYVAFVSLGLPDSLVGSGWPVMHQDLGVPVAFAGILTMIIALGTIVSSLASERITLRFGAGAVTAVSVGMTAAALVGFSVSDQFWMLCLWAIPYGIGAGAVDAALNNYVALHYAARHMNWLHSFWGVGASISPFVMGYAISSGQGWSVAYLVIGLVQAVLTLALLASIPLWGKVDDARTRTSTIETHDLTEDAPAQKGGAPVPLGTALRVPGVVLILLAFFAYCALESTALVWSATYLVAERGALPAAAAMLGALFVLGLTAGRFLAGFFADRVGDRALIRG
ncbi:MAG: MFS transporter, partial [Brachybacterium sp.]|nr:MFS transporter [Brachybacterium sp.]